MLGTVFFIKKNKKLSRLIIFCYNLNNKNKGEINILTRLAV